MKQFPPLHTLLFQVLLDYLLASTFSLHHGVRKLSERLLSHFSLHGRMTSSYEAYKTVPEQALLKNVYAVQIREVTNSKIYLAALQRRH